MSYSAFEICSVSVGDDRHPRRGVRAKCGHCHKEETLPFNTVRSHGEDEEHTEKMVAHKFEKHGWKIGKVPAQHRCPRCFAAAKAAAKQKAADNIAVLKNTTAVASQTIELPPAARSMTRDERRIIIIKLQDIYLNELVGYSNDWSDDKVAKDLGVPQDWVSKIRDETFGPDINEQSARVIQQAKDTIAELAALRLTIDPLLRDLQRLLLKADVSKQELEKLVPK